MNRRYSFFVLALLIACPLVSWRAYIYFKSATPQALSESNSQQTPAATTDTSRPYAEQVQQPATKDAGPIKDADIFPLVEQCVKEKLMPSEVMQRISRKPQYDTTSQNGITALYKMRTAGKLTREEPMKHGEIAFVGWILYSNSPDTEVAGIYWDKDNAPHVYAGILIPRP